MPSKSPLIRDWSARLKSRRAGASQPPLRAELFSLEQLARHAEALGRRHQVVAKGDPPHLLARLEHNEEIIRAFNRETLAVDKTRRITPAAEWLVDNFYLIEEQIQLARRHLPNGYSRELPRLDNGSTPRRLRVYDLILELVSHVDAQVDVESLTTFVASYQRSSPLKLGELWAVPIMLRLALIENLQRIASALGAARADRNLASEWVDRLQDTAEKSPSRLVIVVADMARTELHLTSSFVAEFSRRLAGSNPVLHIARGWLEQRLVEQGDSIEQLVHQESQSQASDQISVSHSIASLRVLSAIDWKGFVEILSVVERTLGEDPARTYRRMDFATRDRYRHIVEAIARHSPFSEMEVAEKAIDLAGESLQRTGHDDRRAHVGYFLVDDGQRQLEEASRTRVPWKKRGERAIQRFPLLFYVGGIAAFTLLVTLAFLHIAGALPITRGALLFCTVTFLLGASQFAVSLLNWFVTLLISPRVLSRLDYSDGISPESRTMVVVPTILSDPAAVDGLIEAIEIHHLANRDPHLHFALLTDWNDAPAEHQPNDEQLLQCARKGIEELNRRYAPESGDLFYLFHRPRRWNASENVWMGYERKRGKLTQFNGRLRGSCLDCFSEIVGDPAIFPSIRYVITLDTDTQLPRESARQLVGTMAHPLNRARFDPRREIVTEGYGLMQPRVDMNLASAGRTWFVQLQAGEAGIDPYTRAVSDVYQDLVGEGSFIGKGIYDVDAFERALAGRFPENSILSHDLLESVYARCALVTDVKFYEEYPARYEVDVVRRHRWVRGDWQIMGWLLPWARGTEGRWRRNPISSLSRWKIFDNLRRSFVPIALVLFLFGCWLLVPRLDGLGTWLVLGILALPGILQTIVGFLRKPPQLPWLMHLRTVAAGTARTFGQIGLTIATMPYEALVSLDAIARTLVRTLLTRKRLLEWRTSSEAARAVRKNLAGSYRDMWIAPAVALAGGLFVLVKEPSQLVFAYPLFALWSAAPWIVWRISEKRIAPAPGLTREQEIFLHRVARKTWHFFEIFVTAEENWLPPDNFQEEPSPTVASRTSPTNIGLSLLASLSAYDFGYLSLERMLQRTEAALATMLKLERHRGHFYNWYDTRT
ncbi:MAG: cyclic beta 1-2 glucan synthetase, partial [Chthoniobacterales bacterium]|nr:cyclic beta 1-2 glucan synthetase [Chthoniobacterales bacterium]